MEDQSDQGDQPDQENQPQQVQQIQEAQPDEENQPEQEDQTNQENQPDEEDQPHQENQTDQEGQPEQQVQQVSKQAEFSFFKLPLEIRQMIYCNLLGRKQNRERVRSRWDCGRTLQYMIDQDYENLNPIAAAWKVRYHFSPEILRTCHQIEDEATEFLYQRNQWVQIRLCTQNLLPLMSLLGIGLVSRHQPNFWNPKVDEATVLAVHLCTFGGVAPCRRNRASREHQFVIGIEDLNELIPLITKNMQSDLQRLYIRFDQNNMCPSKDRAGQIRFERSVLKNLVQLGMTLPNQNQQPPLIAWARTIITGMTDQSLESHFSPRISRFMPVGEFLLFFRKRTNNYITYRWDPRWNSEEDHLREVAFQWFNGFLRYRRAFHSSLHYSKTARTISVQLQIRFHIVQLHQGTYPYQADPLRHSLRVGDLKENQRTIQRFWAGAAWCFKTMDLSVSSAEYQLILNVGWLFTWNTIPPWWEDLWGYVTWDHCDSGFVLEILRQHVGRISRMGDYGSPSGSRDPDGLSEEVGKVVGLLRQNMGR